MTIMVYLNEVEGGGETAFPIANNDTYDDHVSTNMPSCQYIGIWPGGHSTFFSGRGVRPGFPKCRACELIFAYEKGACELKISKFGGLWAENFQILGLVS